MRWGDTDDAKVANYREGVSWLIAARILEYGKNFKIASDPGGGGGMYNLLVIEDAKSHEQPVHLNRNGSIHLFGTVHSRLWWPDAPYVADEVGDEIAAKFGWHERQLAPRPSSSIARLIGRAILDQGPGWVCHPGGVDGTSSRATDFLGSLFERYSGAQERLRVASPLGGDAIQRFFFLVREPSPGIRPQPWLAFDMAGYAWMVDRPEPAAQPSDWPGAVERLLAWLSNY